MWVARGALDSSELPSAPAGAVRLATAKAVAAAVMDKRVVRVFKTLTSFQGKRMNKVQSTWVCVYNITHHPKHFPYIIIKMPICTVYAINLKPPAGIHYSAYQPRGRLTAARLS